MWPASSWTVARVSVPVRRAGWTGRGQFELVRELQDHGFTLSAIEGFIEAAYRLLG